MSNQELSQDENLKSTPPQGDGSEPKTNPFEGLSREELLERVASLDAKIHEVNNESKQRKIKLRELETAQEQQRENMLKEKEEYKALYEELKQKTANYSELLSFRESAIQEQANRLSDMEKLLTASERQEMEILGDLPIDKKLKWVDLKIKNRSIINIDPSSSIKSGGSLKTIPKNRKELSMLSPEEIKKFKATNLTAYQAAIRTP